MAKVFAFLAEGLEEVECLAVVDVLRRAGVETRLVSITGNRMVTGSHNITIQADALFEEVNPDEADLLFLPGGVPGTPNLKAHEGLAVALVKANKQGRRVAAICAAPSILGELGLLEGRRATCFPGFEETFPEGAYAGEKRVVVDGNIITASAMGQALPFALAILNDIAGEVAVAKVREGIQL